MSPRPLLKPMCSWSHYKRQVGQHCDCGTCQSRNGDMKADRAWVGPTRLAMLQANMVNAFMWSDCQLCQSHLHPLGPGRVSEEEIQYGASLKTLSKPFASMHKVHITLQLAYTSFNYKKNILVIKSVVQQLLLSKLANPATVKCLFGLN